MEKIFKSFKMSNLHILTFYNFVNFDNFKFVFAALAMLPAFIDGPNVCAQFGWCKRTQVKVGLSTFVLSLFYQ